ncbi:MAG: glycoside hydrolase family 27 protein [candidate division KSB1 bacterium]|nr:glycoside hydrolase family 27 protein [candidate division KSB1 bacterium]
MRFMIIALLLMVLPACQKPKPTILAQRPPMGWNSWDCFGSDVTEEQVKANVDFMAEHLKPYGWEYIVIDLGWYLSPERTIHTFKNDNPPQLIDEYGRLIPDPRKFPSAKDGKGFKPLADYIHAKGLKFGIHVMRGIPRQAVERNTPILGTDFRAKEIIAPNDTCIWYDGLIGINMNHPGGQAYYNSIARLYAEWGVDYIKADDMSSPYHAAEIEGLSNALKTCGRPIVLSLSPGPAPRDRLEHLRRHAQLWRISGDFWDDWKFLYRQFELCKLWEGAAIPGGWPDADMLPLGKLRKTGPDDYVAHHMGKTAEEITNEYSRFSDVEKQTLMTLWCIFRSPLMFGGHLPETDDFSLKLITNAEALAVNQASRNNRQIYRRDPLIAWAAEAENSDARYVALFNIDDHEPRAISIGWDALGLSGECTVRDLWTQKDLGSFHSLFSVELPPHGSGLYRIEKK